MDRSAFTLGRTCRDAGEGGLALEAYELIEYKPVTHSVDVVRVVMIPSPVNKYTCWT